jgi:multisubunit Na+/H+ antiporter MnhC subunit
VANAAPAAAPGQPRFGDDRRDGPVLLALFSAMAFVVMGLGLLSSALGWPRIGAGLRNAGETDDSGGPAQGFAFRRHWGSFGAESTGWTMSPGLAKLLAGLGLIALAAVLLLVLMPSVEPTGKPSGKAPAATGSPAAPPKSPPSPAAG